MKQVVVGVVCAFALILAGCSSADTTRSAPTTPSINTYAETPTSPLDAIRSDYTDEFASDRYCGSTPDSMCLTMRNQLVRPLTQSVTDLPASKEKSTLLVTLREWSTTYGQWVNEFCDSAPHTISCALMPLNMDASWDYVRVQLGLEPLSPIPSRTPAQPTTATAVTTTEPAEPPTAQPDTTTQAQCANGSVVNQGFGDYSTCVNGEYQFVHPTNDPNSGDGYGPGQPLPPLCVRFPNQYKC